MLASQANGLASLSGPRGLPVVGVIPQLRKDPLGFFLDISQRHGALVPYQLGLNTVLMVNDPALVRHVLQDNFQNYRKSRFYDPLRPILGKGMFLAEGESWLKQRRGAKASFEAPSMVGYVQAVSDAADTMIERWAQFQAANVTFDVTAEMMRYTLDATLRCFLGVRLEDQPEGVYDALTVLLRHADRRIWSLFPVPEAIPTKLNRDYHDAMALLGQMVKRIIADRRASGVRPGDLLTRLIAMADQSEDKAAGEQLLQEQVNNMIFSGHETTAVALAWTWYLLAKHPPVERRLREEAQSLSDGAGFHDFQGLDYTKAVFDESMRLYPPIWTVSRDAVGDDLLGGVPVAKGTSVMLCCYAMHRNPELWDAPEGFDPERFLGERGKSIPRYAYFPFGGGPRVCIGSRFAYLEAMVMLSKAAQRFRLELVPGLKVEPEPLITLRPKQAIMMSLRKAEA